jgi:hypothetical protein
MFYFLHGSILKKLLPVLKNQNGVTIQDGVENVYIYHPIFSKMIFCQFSFFLFTLSENKIFIVKIFLENLKWRHNFI